jgi:hypothetical protein
LKVEQILKIFARRRFGRGDVRNGIITDGLSGQH